MPTPSAWQPTARNNPNQELQDAGSPLPAGVLGVLVCWSAIFTGPWGLSGPVEREGWLQTPLLQGNQGGLRAHRHTGHMAARWRYGRPPISFNASQYPYCRIVWYAAMRVCLCPHRLVRAVSPTIFDSGFRLLGFVATRPFNPRQARTNSIKGIRVSMSILWIRCPAPLSSPLLV